MITSPVSLPHSCGGTVTPAHTAQPHAQVTGWLPHAALPASRMRLYKDYPRGLAGSSNSDVTPAWIRSSTRTANIGSTKTLSILHGGLAQPRCGPPQASQRPSSCGGSGRLWSAPAPQLTRLLWLLPCLPCSLSTAVAGCTATAQVQCPLAGAAALSWASVEVCCRLISGLPCSVKELHTTSTPRLLNTSCSVHSGREAASKVLQ